MRGFAHASCGLLYPFSLLSCLLGSAAAYFVCLGSPLTMVVLYTKISVKSSTIYIYFSAKIHKDLLSFLCIMCIDFSVQTVL